MNYRELELAYRDLQKKVFRLQEENDTLKHGQRWCDVIGSNWEAEQAQAQASAAAQPPDSAVSLAQPLQEKEALDRDTTRHLKCQLRRHEANERLIKVGFRQIKYELYCATVDLLGFSLHIAQDRNCVVTSIYELTSGESQFEFIYDPRQHRYVDMLWSDKLAKYASLYQFWVQENHCLQGFLAAVFLEKFNSRGPPPLRERQAQN